MKIKRGDTVKVIAGDDKGATGVVLQVLPKENRVIVQGVNIVKKHRKPREEYGGEGIADLIFEKINEKYHLR